MESNVTSIITEMLINAEAAVQASLPDAECIYSLEELLTNSEADRDNLLDPILQSVGLGAIVGRPDSGKSMLARQLALQIALGRSEFIGMPLKARYNRAIYVTTEDSIQDTRFVFQRQFEYLAKQNEMNCKLEILFAESLTTDELINSLRRSLQADPADLVVIDSFGDVFSGKDGNSNIDVRKVLKPFASLAQNEECLLLFVTHINKSAYHSAPEQAHVQGAAALVQKLRVVLDLRCDPTTAHRYLSITKGNAISMTDKRFAMKLDFDEQGFVYDDTGDRIPVEEVGAPVSKPPEPKVVWEDIFSGARTLKASELIDRLKENDGYAERTARELMYKQLQRIDRGVYAMPKEQPKPPETEE